VGSKVACMKSRLFGAVALASRGLLSVGKIILLPVLAVIMSTG
jgi:hypothetical protein